MTRLERFALSFIVVVNLFGFGVAFLVLSNGDTVGELTYLGRSDAGFLTTIAAVGVLANICLPLLLVRVLQRGRGSSRPRGIITGE